MNGSQCFVFAFLICTITKVLQCFGQTPPTFDQCGADIDGTEIENGLIKSPNYPTDFESPTKYESNSDCLWTVRGPNENTLFMVRFFDLVLEYAVDPNDPNGTICYDYVNISVASIETEQFCGFEKPEKIVRGVGERLDIHFITDATANYRGFFVMFYLMKDYDACGDDPCKNGGICVPKEDLTFYTCECPEGWTGYTCLADVNECESDPCKNGATCEQTKLNGYRCHCAEGWQGERCEIVRKPDPCLSDPCHNGATCIASDDNEEFTCECMPGYEGIKCRTETDECLSDPCQNGGTCFDEINRYYCECTRLYYGDHCENRQKINGCESSPCSVNGDCVSTDDDGNYRCECLPGWTGRLCEDDLEECSSQPCHNGGVCDDSIKFNHYKCTCVEGYTGRNCEIALEETSTAARSKTPKDKVVKLTTVTASQTSENVLTSPTMSTLVTPLFTTTETDVVLPCIATSPLDSNVIESSAVQDTSVHPPLHDTAPPMCTNPGIPYIEDDTQWIAGSILRFYCVEGFILEGQENLTCLKNESWSVEIPVCVEDKNSTIARQNSGLSPWLATMVTLSTMLAVTLILFVTWIVLKGPWLFGANVTKIMNFSQATLVSNRSDSLKQC